MYKNPQPIRYGANFKLFYIYNTYIYIYNFSITSVHILSYSIKTTYLCPENTCTYQHYNTRSLFEWKFLRYNRVWSTCHVLRRFKVAKSRRHLSERARARASSHARKDNPCYNEKQRRLDRTAASA